MNKFFIFLLLSSTMWAMDQTRLIRNLEAYPDEYKKEYSKTFSIACNIADGKEPHLYRVHNGFGGSPRAQVEKFLTHHVYTQKNQLSPEIYQARFDALSDFLGYSE